MSKKRGQYQQHVDFTEITCKQCGRTEQMSYRTKQPEFCSSKCKNRYHYLKRRQPPKTSLDELELMRLVGHWYDSGLGFSITGLIDLAKLHGVDAAQRAANLVKRAVDISPVRGDYQPTKSQRDAVIDLALERYRADD